MLLKCQGNISDKAPHLLLESGVHGQQTATMLMWEF